MGIFSEVFKTRRSNLRPKGLRKKPVRFEPLERRDLLTTVTLNLASGDAAVVSYDSGSSDIEVTVNGGLQVATDAASLDTLVINGTSGSETITVNDLGNVFDGVVDINAGSGFDYLNLNDAVGSDDTVVAYPRQVDMTTGDGYSVTATDFEQALMYAENDDATDDDFDVIHLRGNDYADEGKVYGDDEIAWMRDLTGNPTDYYLRGKFFDQVHLYGHGGADEITLLDSVYADEFSSRPDDAYDYVKLKINYNNDTDFYRAKMFEDITADFSNGGTDLIEMYDTSGNDSLTVDYTSADMWTANGKHIRVQGMQSSETVNFRQSTGTDYADVNTNVYLDTYFGTWIFI